MYLYFMYLNIYVFLYQFIYVDLAYLFIYFWMVLCIADNL
jgi:hypothetical protein